MPASQTPPLVKESIQQLESNYSSADLTVTPHEYHNIRYTSIYASWKPLVDFSWQIIQQQFGLMESQSSSYAVFIDIAEIWEQYLRKKLADAFKDDGWYCWTVEETKKEVYKEQFYKRRIIPDIVLNKENDYMVFDAKYKRMKGRGDDVDRGDFFQIHSYIQYLQSRGKNVLVGGLLYPITENLTPNEKWHSRRLWGDSDDIDLPRDETDTQFIVDGIVCDEKWAESDSSAQGKKGKGMTSNTEFSDEELSSNTRAFIDRIKRIIKHP